MNAVEILSTITGIVFLIVVVKLIVKLNSIDERKAKEDE